ncbi:hypothetical protein FisN_18Hu091 [Fistulifera solaris]|uniref:VWFA domain-containing protein n=1 Tax=Fistulifera solaris TaxID=1519565 RepID=A0A1Z5JV24_FISSO|nr:hypothetical protein FisN_18Hu091 [Fistulifera solaris]|eukprot:GAX17887.1 hypothetical protein FisN_18Hu091 [Fistulifera solaris]
MKLKRALKFLLLGTSVYGLNTTSFDEEATLWERKVLTLRDIIEREFARRCDSLSTCEGKNYHECDSELPNPTCPLSNDIFIEECGVGCSGWMDETTSIYRPPPNRTLTDKRFIEDICVGRVVADWYKEQMLQDDELGVSPWAAYFGSKEGAFQIVPGRPSKVCGAYDCTSRDWYVGGSSGPKNVVLVLDKSGSMGQGQRFRLMKAAAARVINTLTPSDRVAVVFFDKAVNALADQGEYLLPATKENKQMLVNLIEKEEKGDGTDMYEGMKKAFDILDESSEKGVAVNCNSAILFISDGIVKPSDTDGPDVLKAMVEERINNTAAASGNPLKLFTYSVANGDEEEQDNGQSFLAELACLVDGFWANIGSDDKIVAALSGYYLVFAAGLGSSENSQRTAWTEPYEFWNGEIGITVSAAVYDQSVTPARFIGVVGIDILHKPLIGTFADANEAISRLARRSIESCPRFTATPCELEAIRYATGGEQCMAASECLQNIQQAAHPTCPDSSLHPKNLNANNNKEGRSYQGRGCCGCPSSEVLPTSPPFMKVPTSSGPHTTAPSLRPTSKPSIVEKQPDTPTKGGSDELPSAPTPPDETPLGKILGGIFGSSLFIGIVVGIYTEFRDHWIEKLVDRICNRGGEGKEESPTVGQNRNTNSNVFNVSINMSGSAGTDTAPSVHSASTSQEGSGTASSAENNDPDYSCHVCKRPFSHTQHGAHYFFKKSIYICPTCY